MHDPDESIVDTVVPDIDQILLNTGLYIFLTAVPLSEFAESQERLRPQN